MKEGKTSYLFWVATWLTVLFASFMAGFAVDVFTERSSFWRIVVSFLIHLIPTALVLFALVIAWRWERMGALMFIGLSVAYVVVAWGAVDWLAYTTISGPLFVIGLLFLADWLQSTSLRFPYSSHSGEV